MVRLCGLLNAGSYLKLFGILAILLTGGLKAQTPDVKPNTEAKIIESPKVITTGIVTDSLFVPGPRGVPMPILIPGEIKTAVIPIKGPISSTTFKTIRRKVFELRSQKCNLVVFDMDTPGGEVAAAGQIVKLIRSDLAKIRTVAFVNSGDTGHGAISAGAWIALSCDQIVMAPLTKIGDCAPILMSGTIAGTEREKIETYLRTEFRQAAEANGYSVELLESMVSMHKSVYHIKNTETAEHKLVGLQQYEKLSPEDSKKSKNKWELVKRIVNDKELLTMTTSEAKSFGLCYATANSIDELLKLYSAEVEPVKFDDNWSEQLVNIMTSPAITSILVLGMFFFGSIEMRTPGFGIFGGLAIGCLIILMGSRFLIGLALWWEMGLLAIGVLLLLAEVFVIPGFGVAGFAGILCSLIAMMAMLIDNAPGELPLPAGEISMDFFVNSLVGIMVGFLGAFVLSLIVGRYLPNLPITSRLVLANTEAAGEEPAIDDDSPLRTISKGEKGTLVSDCRPAGKCRFGNNIIDVATDGEFLDKGAAVVAIDVKSGYVLVESLSEQA